MRPKDINSISESKEAIDKAYAALSLIEQLESCMSGFKALIEYLPADHKPEYGVYLDQLEKLITVLDNDSEKLGVGELIKGIPLTQMRASKIERLGLASQVIRLREINKCSCNEIASRLQIDAASVSRFLKFYDSAPLSQKTKYQRSSIFDTTTQYEEVGTMIYRQLARLEDSDAENHVRYISELRQLLKAAHEWMDKVNTQNQMAEVKEAVIDILSTCLPEQQERIIKQFSSIGIKGFRTVHNLEGQ